MYLRRGDADSSVVPAGHHSPPILHLTMKLYKTFVCMYVCMYVCIYGYYEVLQGQCVSESDGLLLPFMILAIVLTPLPDTYIHTYTYIHIHTYIIHVHPHTYIHTQHMKKTSLYIFWFMLSIEMYVCMYVCMYCIYVCMYVNIHVCVCMYVFIYMYLIYTRICK